MKNISIVTKLFLIASTLTSLLLVCTITYYLSVTETTAKLSRFRAVHVATAMELGELYAQGLQTEQALRNVLINPQDDKASANLGKALEDFDRLFAKTSDSAKGLQLHDRLAATRVTWDKGVALKRQIHDLARQGNANAAQELLVKEETPAWRSFKDTILALSAESRNLMQSEAQSIDFKNRATLIMNLGIFSLTAVASMLLLFMFSRSLRTKLDFIIERARDMAAGEGDLTKRIHIDSRDELGQVADYFNQAWDKMDHMIAKVVEHATQIGTYAGQLAIESQRIVRNSRDMAGQSAAVATASEEMSATSNDIARNCTMAADSSQSAGDVAHNGKNVVQKTIDRMGSLKAEVQSSSTVIERLGRSSEQIGEIANTIQDIADQTNLLALNAAIEAARAGEQGRGFAVVADEVRALAARTARATGEIGAMIQAIQQESGQAVSAMHRSAGEVDLGVREAGESGEALVQITARVNEVAMQVSMIATAAEEQTATTSEIVQNISLISRSAEDFNASAANVNTKVQQLLELSDDLKQSISVFKIDASPLMILDTAKSDHVLFVNRIERCLEGAEKLQADQLADHTNCRFGKWYTDKGKELCGLSSSYRQINDPHERIHRLAREAVDLHNRGEHEQAERLVHQVEELSHEIVSLLDQVKTECLNHQIQH